MKVTVIPTITAYPWGAPGHCMGALVEELLEAGHEVQWFVAPIDYEHPEVRRLQIRGAVVHCLPAAPKNYVRWANLRREIDRLLDGEKSLAWRVREFWPEYIFVNDGGTWSGAFEPLFSLLREFEGRYSIISHLNRPRAPFEPEIMSRARLLMNGAKKVFFNSRWSHRLAETQIARSIPNAAIYQLPLRVYPDAPLLWPDTPVARFGMVTRLDCWHKGLDLALEAFSNLRDERADIHLTIAGHGEDASYLRELINYLNVKDAVSLLSYTEDLAKFWSGQEMLILSSRFEGLGVSMLEAMSFGRPVLRTPYGGCEEWIEDGVNGFVCPAAEVDLLVASMKRALDERHRWREMGLAAHAKIKRDLDPQPGKVFLKALRPRGAD